MKAKVFMLVCLFIGMVTVSVPAQDKANNADQSWKVSSFWSPVVCDGQLVDILSGGEITVHTVFKTFKNGSILAKEIIQIKGTVESESGEVFKIKEFGTALGMAFQIKDDIFDYLPQGVIGKPSGNDIKEKKLTIPLIYALSQVSKSEQKRILGLVRKSKHDSKALQTVLDFTHQNGGVDYGIKTMIEYRDKAKQLIAEFPSSPHKDSLIMLCDYIVERKK